MSVIQKNMESIEYTYDIYKAEITENNGRKGIKPKQKNGIMCRNFVQPVTNNSISKIYVIINRNKKIIYIGKTTQSITNRLRQGLNPIHDTGYHGYRWQEKEIVYIHCITIPAFSDLEIESTEAELVFIHRKETGKWPLYQTEIHFSNNHKAIKASEELYMKIKKNLTTISTL